jgi:hypothetical protein
MWTNEAPTNPGFYFCVLFPDGITIIEVKKELLYGMYNGVPSRKLWAIGWDMPIYDGEVHRWWSEKIKEPNE